MSKLHVLVPVLPDGKLVVVPTHGDCLTVERMLDAKELEQQTCRVMIASKDSSLCHRNFTTEALCCKLVYT